METHGRLDVLVPKLLSPLQVSKVGLSPGPSRKVSDLHHLNQDCSVSDFPVRLYSLQLIISVGILGLEAEL